MNIYESCKTSIRVTYFAFIMIAFGYLIQNDSVNVFYTFRSDIILFISEFCLRVGELVVMNLPLIFMLNYVCKKANNASPVILALVGYFTFSVTTMLLSRQNLDAQAYASGLGLNSVFNMASGNRLPLETGLIGSFLVGFATRVSFILSRHRGRFSITYILSRDAAGIAYNFLICFVLGVVVAYGYPIVFTYLKDVINFISNDLMDPLKIGLYSVIDRVLSILGLGNIIRYPFWFTSLGGSYSNTLTGQSILGDINIWKYIKETNATYLGAGRFITPYYVINMFIIPAFYLGTLLTMSDKNDRRYMRVVMIVAIVLSVVAGNPLPCEYMMLFTSPLLLLAYLGIVGIVSGVLVNYEAFLGFVADSTNTITAMPGSFPDFIINIRNASLSPSLMKIVIVGAISFVVFLLVVVIYYRFLANDPLNPKKSDKLVEDLIESVGGVDNIIEAGSGLYKLNIYIINPEKISIDKMKDIGIRKVVETRTGFTFELGTSACAIANSINKNVKASKS